MAVFRFLRSRIITIVTMCLAVVLVLALTWVIGFLGGVRAAREPETNNNHALRRVTNVRVEPVEPGEVLDRVALPGTTHPIAQITLSAEVAGRVVGMRRKEPGREHLLREGDPVKAGDLIAEIDTVRLKNQLQRARASCTLAESRYRRVLKLFEDKDRLATELALDEARSERDVARANVESIQIELAKTRILSPVTGNISKLYVDEAEYVDVGQKVAEVSNFSRIEVRVPVPERDIRFLRTARKHGQGSPALIVFDFMGGDRAHYRTQVHEVVPVADERTKTYPVKIVLENNPPSIQPGMVAHVVLLRQRIKNAITAPLDSLVSKEGGHVVFVVAAPPPPSGKPGEGAGVPKDALVAVERKVKLGALDGLRIQIRKGLKPGDRLVVSGQRGLAPGQLVKVVETVRPDRTKPFDAFFAGTPSK